MRRKYESAEVEILNFEAQDVITSSKDIVGDDIYDFNE